MTALSAEQFSGWLFSRLIEEELLEFIPRDHIKLIAERTAHFFYHEGALEGGELIKWLVGEYGLPEDQALDFLGRLREEAQARGMTVLFPGEEAPERKEKEPEEPKPELASAPPTPKKARPAQAPAQVQGPSGLKAFVASRPLLFFGGIGLILLLTAALVMNLSRSRPKTVELDLSAAGIAVESVQGARDMLMVRVNESDWRGLSPDERKKAIGRIFDAAGGSGYKQLQVQSGAGRILAQAADRETIVWF